MRKLGLLEANPPYLALDRKGLWDHEFHVVDVGGERITRRSSPCAQRNLLSFIFVFTYQSLHTANSFENTGRASSYTRNILMETGAERIRQGNIPRAQ